MAAEILFLLLLGFKYRRKQDLHTVLLIFIVVISQCILQVISGKCKDVDCINGQCLSGSCICDKGWRGSACEFCSGRVRLTSDSGYITDGPGNYSVDIQCTWLIDAGRPNVTIRLSLNQFTTECSWDHLYIHDGDSVFAPLVAVYSGISGMDENESVLPEVVTRSGYAFVHFYSDAAFNMTGFNISYRVNSCPQNCSGHGVCVDGVCTCWGSWKGEDCSVPECSKSNCKNGKCSAVGDNHVCLCHSGYSGQWCDKPVFNGYWEKQRVNGLSPVGRAGHQAVVNNDIMWVIGGEYFNASFYQNVVRYNFKKSEWSKFKTNGKAPTERYGHSVVFHKGYLYMYGGLSISGKILKDVWKLEISTGKWILSDVFVKPTECSGKLCGPLAAVGHTATLVEDKMVIIFGHNPMYGYMNSVQEYHFESSEWLIVKTAGAIVKGGYGHSSVYDSTSKLIYVHGGYQSDTPTSYTLVDTLCSYDPFTYTWRLLRPSLIPRFFHSAVISNSVMLVYGGNTHNGSRSLNKCYSADFLAYDTACDVWTKLKDPKLNGTVSTARVGHTALMYDEAMYIYGGFSGQLSNDIIKYSPGICLEFTDQKSCVKSLPGLKCVWHRNKQRCQSISLLNKPNSDFIKCPQKSTNNELCSVLSCPSCLHNSYGCVWCGSYCSYQKCNKDIQIIRSMKYCNPADSSRCDKFHNCFSCHTEKYCGWHGDNKCYTFVREIGNRTEKAILTDEHRPKCDVPCSERKNCQNCTQGQCLWCSSENRCIDNNAYIVSFPIGQCREWTNHAPKCPASKCSEIKSCQSCQNNPECGWCDDGSGTGLGLCTEGSSQGPVSKDKKHYKLNRKLCSSSHWFYTSCPKCQCNGHSKCGPNSNVCNQPCQHLTEGSKCEHCIAGYYGNPINGGNCTQCDCNGHASLCHRDTGKCYCTTKGITGHRCDHCDESSKYYGNPSQGGTCFYNLTIDYQFTFNMSKPDDAYYTQINFKNTPTMADVDVEFSITCSSLAMVNISLVSADSSEEKTILDGEKCNSFKITFPHKDYVFGTEDNTTFYVYVYDFKTPMSVQVSFSQHRTLDLLQFFITFSSCFLSLLVIAAIMWKVKQKYELFRRRQRLFVEMEHMASRPFSSVLLDIDQSQPPDSLDSNTSNTSSSNKNKVCPSPIALEPCYGNRAAVLSLLVRLPTGGEEYSFSGQSGLAVASALVTLGSPQKNTIDGSKSDVKCKNRKTLSPSHRDTCI